MRPYKSFQRGHGSSMSPIQRDLQTLECLASMPFIDTAELAGILGDAHSTIHRALTGLLAEGIVGRASHGTAPPTVEPEILPDGQRYQKGGGTARLRDALGLRAGLPHVQGVAGAAHPQDGRGGERLPTRCLDIPRHRRAPVPGGVPPQGPLRRRNRPARRPQLRRGAPGPAPCGAGHSTTG